MNESRIVDFVARAALSGILAITVDSLKPILVRLARASRSFDQRGGGGKKSRL
jgi:hypothetical protein